MATPKYNTYVGMRYVPIFDGEWDRTKTYEPLVIVSNQGNSYTSRTFVPTGVDITNETYWALTGNYNAQVEYYRRETARVAEELKTRAKIYDNVAAMVADSLLTLGESCFTLGYYNINDNGSAIYELVNTPSAYTIELDNGLYAMPIICDSVTPEMFGAYGDGIHDDTEAIQTAINASTSVVFNGGKIYKVSADSTTGIALTVLSNRKIDLNNATIKLIGNSLGGYAMMNLNNVSNVIIENGNITGDRDEHTGNTGEWGHGISVDYASNVTLSNLYVSKCFGDGVYVGNTSLEAGHNENVTVNNVVCDSNRRNGMSVTDGTGIIISKSKFLNTNGTSPQAGLDIEPNNANALIDIIVENVECLDNGGDGFGISDHVGIENCRFSINNLVTDSIWLVLLGANNTIICNNVYALWNHAYYGLTISNKEMSSAIFINDLKIDCVKQTTPKIPIQFRSNYQKNIKIDGLTICNGEVARLTSWERSAQTETANITINDFKIYNLVTPATGDTILVPRTTNVFDCKSSLKTGNIPPAVELTLTQNSTAIQAYSHYKVISASENNVLSFVSILPGKKVYIENASGVNLRVLSVEIPIANPTESNYSVLPTGKTCIVDFEDSLATGKSYVTII